MLSARCLDDARYENTRRYKYFGGLPASGPLRGTAGRGEKIFRNDRNLSDYHSEKSKRVVFPSNRRQKLLAQARPERRRADPHQREGTIPRRDMGATAPTYRLSETYPHKMTKSYTFLPGTGRSVRRSGSIIKQVNQSDCPRDLTVKRHFVSDFRASGACYPLFQRNSGAHPQTMPDILPASLQLQPNSPDLWSPARQSQDLRALNFRA